MKEYTGKNLICKNDIVDAVKDYSPNQVKLFYNMLYHYKSEVRFLEMDPIAEFRLEFTDISRILKSSKITEERLYEMVDTMPNEIKMITDKKLVRLPVFNYLEYEFSSKAIFYKVNLIFAEMFLEILDQYTIIQLQQLSNLNSKYSQRLYELGRRYVGQTNYLMPIDDFKRYFQVPPSYQMSNIDNYILKPAIRELNEKTSIKCRVSKKKKGVKITHLLFTFTKNTSNKTLEEGIDEL
mgnify:CR=1 FL=1